VLGEPVTSSLLVGAPLVLAGVYLGALSDRSRRMSISVDPVRR
jgi:drug/metabolite transporter (DMT)-like permease